MITLTICSTIIICVFLFLYYVSKMYNKSLDEDSNKNMLYNDVYNIIDIINRINVEDIFDKGIKENILNIKTTLSKYYDEEDIDTSSKES